MAGAKRQARGRRCRPHDRRHSHDEGARLLLHEGAPAERRLPPDPSDASYLDGLLGQVAAVVEREASCFPLLPCVGGQHAAPPQPPALIAAVSEILGLLSERWQGLCSNHQAWADSLFEETRRRGGQGPGRGRGLGREPSGMDEVWLLPCSRDEGWDARLARAALLLLGRRGFPGRQSKANCGLSGGGLVGSAGAGGHAAGVGGGAAAAAAAAVRPAAVADDAPTVHDDHQVARLQDMMRAGLLAAICRAWCLAPLLPLQRAVRAVPMDTSLPARLPACLLACRQAGLQLLAVQVVVRADG